MSKSKRDSALLEELQKDLNDACVALKKTADIPITRFTLSIPSFFDTDPSLLGLCKQLIADLTSIDAWNQYIVQISVHKDTYRTQFVKLLNCLLRFVNIMSNKNNQQLIDMMVLLAEIQRNDEESLKSFRQFANMKLGLKSATFVVKYAKYECLAVSDTNADVPDDVPVHRAIGIIKAGIKAKAEPIKKLQDALDHYNGILEEINRKIMSTSMTEADDFVTAEVAPRRSARKSLSSQAAPLPAAEFDDGEVEFKRPDAKKAKTAAVELELEDRTIAMPARATGRGRVPVAPAPEGSFDDGEVVFQKKAGRPAVAAAAPVFDDGEVVVKQTASSRKRKSMSKADAAAAAAAADDEDDTLSLADYCPTVVVAPVAKTAKTAAASAPEPVSAAPEPMQVQAPEKSIAVRKRRVSFVGGKAKEPATSSSSGADAAAAAAGSFTNIFADSSRMLVVNNHHYVRLTLLGKGGSSAVHRVASVENGEIYAYKRVETKDGGGGGAQDEENSVMEGYINEIKLLKSLSGSAYTIQLFNYEINREQNYISMIMEAGDVDLAKVLQKAAASKAGAPAAGMNPFFTRLMWQEMLESVDYIHANHVIHGDLKPANFVFIKGHLKLIDFGIAKSYNGDQTTNIYRDSQIGTVNYMAPEAISPFVPEDTGAGDSTTGRKGRRSSRGKSGSSNNDTNGSMDNSTGSVAAKVMKLGRASDIWSLGCILYQMIYGKPPFSALNTIQKLHAIPNPNYAISYPSLVPASFCGKEGCAVDLDAVDSIKSCLVRNPKERAPIKGDVGLLSMPYLTMDGNSRRAIEKPSAIVMTTLKNGGKKPQLVIEDEDGGDSEDMSMDSEELAKAAKAKSSAKAQAAKAKTASDSDEEGATVAVKANQLKALGTRPARLNARNSRSPVRSPVRSSGANNENQPPVAASQVNARPTRAMPMSLAHQIQSKAAALTDSKSANKWQKAVNPEGKGDMKSVLEKRFAAIRHFLEEDESDDEEETNNFDSNMSFI